MLDSQSIRSSEAGGVRGYDAGKKLRIPRDGDQHSELMSITIPK
jgi:hypothetical protein